MKQKSGLMNESKICNKLFGMSDEIEVYILLSKYLCPKI